MKNFKLEKNTIFILEHFDYVAILEYNHYDPESDNGEYELFITDKTGETKYLRSYNYEVDIKRVFASAFEVIEDNHFLWTNGSVDGDDE